MHRGRIDDVFPSQALELLVQDDEVTGEVLVGQAESPPDAGVLELVLPPVFATGGTRPFRWRAFPRSI